MKGLMVTLLVDSSDAPTTPHSEYRQDQYARCAEFVDRK